MSTARNLDGQREYSDSELREIASGFVEDGHRACDEERAGVVDLFSPRTLFASQKVATRQQRWRTRRGLSK